MELKQQDTASCDVLVIGGGGAGLTAAIRAREAGADVVIASKSRVGYGNNTYISKGVFAAATGRPDSNDGPEAHGRDTFSGGRSINDPGLVKAVTARAADQIAFLERCGAAFHKRDGTIQIHQTPGHGYPRHVRSEHQSGKEFILPLRGHAQRIGVRFADRVFITRLFSGGAAFRGALGVTHKAEAVIFAARCGILATGGFGQVYQYTNNAAGMTGDGHVLAYELDLPLRDMEFVQFYPTALSRGTRILLYEAFMARAGAVLRNSLGEDILVRNGLPEPMKVTRDQLARTIMIEVLEGRDVDGGVIMDMASVSDEDLTRLGHLLPPNRALDQKEYHVSPTTHFCMGGIATDARAGTALKGLYAAGEVCGGMHGANRLAGNALTEVFAMGAVSGEGAAEEALGAETPPLDEAEIASETARLESLLDGGKGGIRELRKEAGELMWANAGIIRDSAGLAQAVGRIVELRARISRVGVRDPRELFKYLELKNMLTVSEMVCRAALMRTESRGAHFRKDWPEENNEDWLKNIIVRKQGPEMALEAVEVGK